MKRVFLLAGAVTLCTLALFAVYCADVKFDNPLDEKAYKDGTINDTAKWLWDIIDENCQSQNITVPAGYTCGTYIRDSYLNPAVSAETKNQWKTKLGGCVGQSKPDVKIEPPTSATLYYNHPTSSMGAGGFDKLMGRSGTVWEGVVKYSEGASVEAVLTKDGTAPYAYQGQMPPAGSYIIRYIASKMKCGSAEMEYGYDTKTLTILEYTPDDTDPPSITFDGTCKNEYIQNENIGAVHSCVSAGLGNVLTNDVIRKNGAVVAEVTTETPAVFTVTYKACKTLIHGGVPDPAPTCVTRDRTITVIENSNPGGTPTPVIVLNNYTYTVGGAQFSTPEGVLRNGESYVEKGVARVFYIKEGAEVPVDPGRVTISPPPKPSDFTDAMVYSGAGKDVTYTIEASGSDYGKATATRTIYGMDATCNTAATPTFTFRKPSAAGWVDVPAGEDPTLTISSKTPWTDAKSSVNMDRITGTDGGEPLPERVRAFKLGADYPANFNPYNPQPGNYKITYIAVSPCPGGGGFFRSAERTIVVSP